MPLDSEKFITETKKWVENLVIALNLCPFAQRVHSSNLIRYTVSPGDGVEDVIEDVMDELDILSSCPANEIETTLVIAPFAALEFFEYLEYLDAVEQLIIEMNLAGVIQVASFHPYYRFEGEDECDVTASYTNKSPFPMFHLIREESITRARLEYENIDDIPNRNKRILAQLGIEKLLQLLK